MLEVYTVTWRCMVLVPALPEHTALGDAVLAPEFSCAVGPEGSRAASVEFPRLTVPACPLGACGG
jgi:hypothetical protein